MLCTTLLGFLKSQNFVIALNSVVLVLYDFCSDIDSILYQNFKEDGTILRKLSSLPCAASLVKKDKEAFFASQTILIQSESENSIYHGGLVRNNLKAR